MHWSHVSSCLAKTQEYQIAVFTLNKNLHAGENEEKVNLLIRASISLPHF